jgi:adenosylcobinamide kinase/adenosylcobinamide-phosphate guanylyltransferase
MKTMPDVTFVLGGARSGKSLYAERLAHESARPVTYIATARGADDEFAARIAHHRVRRPSHWALVEAGDNLAAALSEADREGRCVLIDCLTLWLAGLLCPLDATEPPSAASEPSGEEPATCAAKISSHLDAFEAALTSARGQVIIVSNEIGLGVVPLGSITRQYVDELGRLNQRIAAIAPTVTFMVAGLPLAVKGGRAA